MDLTSAGTPWVIRIIGNRISVAKWFGSNAQCHAVASLSNINPALPVAIVNKYHWSLGADPPGSKPFPAWSLPSLSLCKAKDCLLFSSPPPNCLPGINGRQLLLLKTPSLYSSLIAAAEECSCTGLSKGLKWGEEVGRWGEFKGSFSCYVGLLWNAQMLITWPRGAATTIILGTRCKYH